MNTNRTMKELPESERPYEKCLRDGPGVLSDAELLAVILRCGSTGATSVDLSREILELLASRGGLGALCCIPAEELLRVRGIGRVKAVQLLCIGELPRRTARQSVQDGVRLTSPSSIAAYFMEDMRHLGQEEIRAAFFNTKGRLLSSAVLTRGTVNASLITPWEVFLEALRHQAVYVVLLHNHPSGDPTPSQDDCILTERMIEAGHLMEITLTDHIVIGDNCYVSLRERGFIE